MAENMDLSPFVAPVLKRGLLLLVLLTSLLSADRAFAHKTHVFAYVQGKAIQGEVYFSGGSPAREATVAMFDPSGKKLGEATTDEKGEFSYQPRVRCDHRVVFDSGDGHAAEYTVAGGELPADLPTPANPAPQAETTEKPDADESPVELVTQSPEPNEKELHATIEAAVARQIIPLRKQLDRYEQKTRLRDILGGIGYILGLMGLTYYLLSRRNQKSD